MPVEEWTSALTGSVPENANAGCILKGYISGFRGICYRLTTKGVWRSYRYSCPSQERTWSWNSAIRMALRAEVGNEWRCPEMSRVGDERLSFSRRSRDATNVLHRQESITYGSDHAVGIMFWVSRNGIVILVAFQVSARGYTRPRALAAFYNGIQID